MDLKSPIDTTPHISQINHYVDLDIGRQQDITMVPDSILVSTVSGESYPNLSLMVERGRKLAASI